MTIMIFRKRFGLGEDVSEGFRNDLTVVFARSALRTSESFTPFHGETNAPAGNKSGPSYGADPTVPLPGSARFSLPPCNDL